MPCALPPVDQAASQLGWGYGRFYTTERGVAAARHYGLDFMADAGSPVIAPLAGVVVDKGFQPYGGAIDRLADAHGHWVVIGHGVTDPRGTAFGLPTYTRYSHLQSESPLTVGRWVQQGDLVGRVGTSGLAPPSRSRPRLFFEAADLLSDRDIRNPHVSPGGNPLEQFFGRLGVVKEGGEAPGRPITPYVEVPPWGGRLVQNDACGTMSGIDPRVQQSKYARYGSTQLSSTSKYAPATYAASSASGGGVGALAVGALVGLGLWFSMRKR